MRQHARGLVIALVVSTFAFSMIGGIQAFPSNLFTMYQGSLATANTPFKYLGGPYPMANDSGYGICHFEMILPNEWFTGMPQYYNDSLLHKSALMIRDAGITWNRFEFAWSTVQPNATTWDWSALDAYMNFSDNYGLRILPILAYGTPWACRNGDYLDKIENMTAWTTYVSKVVTRYMNRSSLSGGWWEIWNEANIRPFFHGDFINDFVPAMVAAAQEIRAVAPTAKIMTTALTANIAGDLSRMITAIGKDQFNALFDGVSIHPYADTIADVEQKIADVKNVLAGWYKGEIWITEVGWPVNPALQGAAADLNKAQVIAKTLVASRAMGVTHTFIHMWCDWGSVVNGVKIQNATYDENWFGIVDIYANPKPSYFAYKTVASCIGYSRYLGDPPSSGWDVGNQQVEAHVFHQQNGTAVIPAWTLNGESVPVTLEFPWPSNVTIMDVYGNVISRSTRVTSVSLTIGGDMNIIFVSPGTTQAYSAQDFTISYGFSNIAIIAIIVMPALIIATIGLALHGLRAKRSE